MKILGISNFYPPHYIGGYELGCQQIMNALAARGHEIAILCGSHGVEKPTIEDNVHRLLDVRLSWPKGIPGLAAIANRERKNQQIFRTVVANFTPDIVYFWNVRFGCQSLLFVAEDLKKPSAYFVSDQWLEYFGTLDSLYVAPRCTSQNPVRHIVRGLGRLWLRFKNCRLPAGLTKPALIQFCSEYLLKQSKPFPCENKRVVHWGVDPPAAAPSTRQFPPQRMLYVGQLVPHKGVHTTIDGFGRFVRNNNATDARLTIVGSASDPGYLADLEKIVSERSLESKVVFTGKLPREKVFELYGSHDLLIFPSEWPEPFSIALLEALAHGLPVVGTGTGGTPEILADGENAVIFEAGSAQSLEKAINRLSHDQQLFERLQTVGRDSINRSFRFDQMIEKIERQLLDVVSSQKITTQ